MDRRTENRQVFNGSDADTGKDAFDGAYHFMELCLTEADIGNLRFSWVNI